MHIFCFSKFNKDWCDFLLSELTVHKFKNVNHDVGWLRNNLLVIWKQQISLIDVNFNSFFIYCIATFRINNVTPKHNVILIKLFLYCASSKDINYSTRVKQIYIKRKLTFKLFKTLFSIWAKYTTPPSIWKC